jgi:hypothetical protein
MQKLVNTFYNFHLIIRIIKSQTLIVYLISKERLLQDEMAMITDIWLRRKWLRALTISKLSAARLSS